MNLGKTFTFDHVIQPKATQQQVYETCGKPIVSDVLNGYNGTVFVYGQTSSGKTFSMEGVLGDPVYQGIIPRIIHDIFEHIYNMDAKLEFHIKVSYMEIYLEKIRDLLDVSKDNLSVHEDRNKVPFVKGLTEHFVSSPEDVFEVLDIGKSNRKVAVTNMNEHSSRSHSIFMIQVAQEDTENHKKKHGKLYLVDLAGSEKVSKTGAAGQTLDEAKEINKSLSALGNVINSLVEGRTHVPYRDSKLTRILQESLGGNARTTMVICCSPAAFNETETKSTLLFGMRAKTIKNNVQVNEELSAEEWKKRWEKEAETTGKLRGIIARLTKECNRWRSGESVPKNEWFTEDQYSKFLQDSSPAAGGGGPPGPAPGPVSAVPESGAKKRPPPKTAEGIDSDVLNQLYSDLDDREAEIAEKTQTINKLLEKESGLQKTITKTKEEVSKRDKDLARLHKEVDTSKEEVKEVLQALEELAMNYDQKVQELEEKSKALTESQEQLMEKSSQINTRVTEVENLKENYQGFKKRYNDVMVNLLKDLTDVGMQLSSDLGKPSFKPTDRLEEQFSVMRIYIAKTKATAKAMNQNNEKTDGQLKKITKELDALKERTRVLENANSEYKINMDTMKQRVDAAETGKRLAESEKDALNDTIAQLKTQEKILQSQSKVSIDDIKTRIETDWKKQSDHLLGQLQTLRTEVQTKMKDLTSCQDNVKHFKFESEKLREQIKVLKTEAQERGKKLEILEQQTEKRDQAKQDLKGLEETVIRELQTLHNLRKMFVTDLQNRIKKTSSKTSLQQILADDDDQEDDESRGSLVQRQKIAFLENNLEQLTRVHKQLVRDNADLRCELPKLEKRLRATVDRVKALEFALKEAKEGGLRDRKRYKHEVDRIKEAVKQRTFGGGGRRPPQAQVAMPIRAGNRVA